MSAKRINYDLTDKESYKNYELTLSLASFLLRLQLHPKRVVTRTKLLNKWV